MNTQKNTPLLIIQMSGEKDRKKNAFTFAYNCVKTVGDILLSSKRLKMSKGLISDCICLVRNKQNTVTN